MLLIIQTIGMSCSYVKDEYLLYLLETSLSCGLQE